MKRIAIGSLRTVQLDSFAKFISSVFNFTYNAWKATFVIPEAVFLLFTSNFVNFRLSSRISKGEYLAVPTKWTRLCDTASSNENDDRKSPLLFQYPKLEAT